MYIKNTEELRILNDILDLKIGKNIINKIEYLLKNNIAKSRSYEWSYLNYKEGFSINIDLCEEGYDQRRIKYSIIEIQDRFVESTFTYKPIEPISITSPKPPNLEDRAILVSLYNLLGGTAASKKSFRASTVKECIKKLRDHASKISDHDTRGIYNKTILEDSEHLNHAIYHINKFLKTNFTDLTSREAEELSKSSPDNCVVGKVLDVQEVGNVRYVYIASYSRMRSSYYHSGPLTTYRICEFYPRDIEYNYMDKGRLFIKSSAISDTKDDLLFMADDIRSVEGHIDMYKHFCEADSPSTVRILDKSTHDRGIKKFNRKNALLKNKEDAVSLVRIKIQSKFSKLKDTPLVLNGVTYTDTSITYEGQVLSSDIVSVESILLGYVRSSWQDPHLQNLNFDLSSEAFFNKLVGKITNNANEKITATIGSIEVSLLKTYSTTGTGVASARYYINNIRINKEELSEILPRALCFDDTQKFNDFLKQVSKCSLKIHGFLDKGLQINVKDPRNSDMLQFTIKLARKNNRQYLDVSNKLYLVKDTPKLLTISREYGLSEVIRILSNPAVVELGDPTVLKKLVLEGRIRLKESIEKSKKLLESTLKVLNVTPGHGVTGDNKNINGYIIKGKRNTYLIENDIDNEGAGRCGVYRLPDMKYICIVDKSPKQQVGVDNLVNRLYALSNDSVLASQIHTI